MPRRPKVELHLHLDCSLSYACVAQLDPSITRAEYEAEFVAPPRCSGLADFLTRAPRGFQLMQTEAALRIAVVDVFEQLAADGVIYTELRFAPLLHLAGGLSARQVVAQVERVTGQCIRASGIEARVILCTLRHFSEQQSLTTARLVDEFKGSHIVALDLAGDEAGFPISAHVPAFRFAKDRGLYRTAHAGEALGAASVWETLRAFEPTRIGHGVRSIEDPALIAHLCRERIHLEVCPTSNIQTGAYLSYEAHPVDRLYRAGVSVGINTDTRTITNVTLCDEYGRLERTFGWSDEEFTKCNQEPLKAAFLDSGVRTRLTKMLGTP